MRHVCAVMLTMPVCGDVMRDVFMHWSNVLAGLVSRAIFGWWTSGVMRRHAFRVGGGVCFFGFAARRLFKKALLAPEPYRHQARHVRRRSRCGYLADQADKPAERDVEDRGRVPEDL